MILSALIERINHYVIKQQTQQQLFCILLNGNNFFQETNSKSAQNDGQ